MMFTTRLLPLLAVLVAPLCGSAEAMDYEVGTSIICDTQTQVERFVAPFSGDTQAARSKRWWVLRAKRISTLLALVAKFVELRRPHKSARVIAGILVEVAHDLARRRV
jgi:hypothetical protein